MTDPLGPPPDPGCAACDHLRRECPPDCILRPYFPLSERQRFENVNRHFGVPGLTSILEKVAPEDRDDAVKSIIYESNAHATFPVGGCVTFLQELQRRIKIAEAQLRDVRMWIDFVRSRTRDR